MPQLRMLSAVKTADNELITILGEPTWQPVTNKGVDLYYVDPFGFGYWGADGQLGGLATNTGHIPGAGNPWPNVP